MNRETEAELMRHIVELLIKWRIFISFESHI